MRMDFIAAKNMEESRVNFKSVAVCLFVFVCAFSYAGQGTNDPGTFTDFQVPVSAANTTLTLEVLKSGNIGSHILVKFGSAMTSMTDFAYASRVDGDDNRLALERPELQTGNYF